MSKLRGTWEILRPKSGIEWAVMVAVAVILSVVTLTVAGCTFCVDDTASSGRKIGGSLFRPNPCDGDGR